MARSSHSLFLTLSCSFLLLLTPACASTLKYFDCGSSTSLVTVKEVVMEPDPAVSGEDMTFIMPATASSEITGGTVTILVLFRGVPVHVERDPLCDKTDCPVAAGDDFIFKNSQPLPLVTPAGPYTVRMSVVDQDSKVLFCERMQFQIVKPAQPKSLFEKVRSVFGLPSGSIVDDVGFVMEEAEKAWNMTADAKVALRKVLMASNSWEWNNVR